MNTQQNIETEISLNDMIIFVEQINQIQHENPNTQQCVYLNDNVFDIAIDDKNIEESLIVVSDTLLKDVVNLFQKGAESENSDLVYQGIGKLVDALITYEMKMTGDNNE